MRRRIAVRDPEALDAVTREDLLGLLEEVGGLLVAALNRRTQAGFYSELESSQSGCIRRRYRDQVVRDDHGPPQRGVVTVLATFPRDAGVGVVLVGLDASITKALQLAGIVRQELQVEGRPLGIAHRRVHSAPVI